MNEHKELLTAALTDDILKQNTREMSMVRVAIIEDRRFDIPDWMYEYVTGEDLMSILLDYRSGNIGIISEECKLFLQRFDDMPNISYRTLAGYIDDTDTYDLVYLFDPRKLYKKLAFFIKWDDRDEMIAITCIMSFLDNDIAPPIQYLNGYVSTCVANGTTITDCLIWLLDYVDVSKWDLLYPVIYSAYTTHIDSVNGYTYYDYLKKGGVWYRQNGDIQDVIQYIDAYIASGNASKPMDNNIEPTIAKFSTKYISGHTEDDAKKMDYLAYLIGESIRCHLDNIEYIFLLPNPEKICTKHKMTIEQWALTEWHRPVANFDLLVYVLSETSGVYPKTAKLLQRQITLGLDGYQIATYIDCISDDSMIWNTLSIMSESQLAELVSLNPRITDLTTRTFVDVIFDNIKSFPEPILIKLRSVFSSSAEFLKLLESYEVNLLFPNNAEYTNLCAQYPRIAELNDNISIIDVMDIYNKNPDILKYISPASIPWGLLRRHILSDGYIQLQNISEYGIENVLETSDLVDMMSSGDGYGFLLDFSKIGYRNFCLLLGTKS